MRDGNDRNARSREQCKIAVFCAPVDEVFDPIVQQVAAGAFDQLDERQLVLKGDFLHAQQLLGIARNVRCKFNLIPFNPFPQSGLKRSSAARVKQFAQSLMDGGVVTTVRKTRGDDIAAACGQLAGDIRDRTRIEQRLPDRAVIQIKQERA